MKFLKLNCIYRYLEDCSEWYDVMVLFLMILNFSFLVDEFCDMMIRIGNLCIDLFYIIGKISVCVVLYNMKDGFLRNKYVIFDKNWDFCYKMNILFCSF